METGRFHIAQTGIFLWDKNVRIKFVQVNDFGAHESISWGRGASEV